MASSERNVPTPSGNRSWQQLFSPWLRDGDVDLPQALEALLEQHPELCAQLEEALASSQLSQDSIDREGLAATIILPSDAAGSAARDHTSSAATPVSNFGDYELFEEIGRGGMGIVYKARQSKLGRTVALKMILAGELAGPADVRRFRAEAEAAAKLDHPHIIPVYDVGECHGRHFFSMAYVEGPTLDHVLKMHPLPAESAAEIVRKVALAVHYAHDRGIIHRDLKPPNILIDPNGEPKITDFGLAKLRDVQSVDERTGDIVGTPSYLSPEQAAGRVKEVGVAADVYGLGAILYACLTGRPPFQADSKFDTLLAVLEAEATLPSKLNPETPRELEWIVLRCLEKNPEKRYPTAQALADDLQRFLLGENVAPWRWDLATSMRRWFRRQPSLVSHLVVIATMMGLHQILHWTIGGSITYLVNMTLLFCAWGIASIFYQTLLERPRRADIGRYLWAATDAGLLTLALYMTRPPLDGLLIGYPLLVVAAALFFRVRLVLFMLAACLLGIAVLSWGEPALRDPLYPLVYYIAGLLAIGLMTAYQVYRIRVLSRYFHRDGA